MNKHSEKTRDIDRRLENLDRSIDGRLAELDRRIERQLDGEASPKRRTTAPDRPLMTGSSRHTAPDRAGPEQHKTIWRLADLPRPRNRFAPDLDAGLETSEAEIRQIAAFVFTCPFVQQNAIYAGAASDTAFIPILDDPEVNAFATIVPVPDDGGDEDALLSAIFLQGGAANMARLLSLAVVADQQTDTDAGILLQTIRAAGARMIKHGGEISLESVADIVEETGIGSVLAKPDSLRLARSYAAGILLEVIAHELGHHALGHLGDLERKAAEDCAISRNQEREADSFASSVIRTCAFQDYLTAGPILFNLAWVWAEHTGNKKIATTHPLALERLMDYIRSNEDQAAEIGVDKETIKALLPEGVEG